MIGALIGDTVGSVYEFNNKRTKNIVLFSDSSFLTDDSIMTLAVAEMLQKKCVYNKDKIVETFKRWGRAFPDAGYGGRFYNWLFSDNTLPYNSFGNGAAMRISPVGWYANSEEEVVDFATRVTEVTHNHPEGIKGAIVTAMCIYYARIGKDKEFIKKYVEQYYSLDFDYDKLKKNYYFNETCQNTVPQAIYCFLISKDFEDCIRTTISIGGDCDTTAAIACSIAEAYYKGVPKNYKDEIYNRLPDSVNGCEARKILRKFVSHQTYVLTQCEEITKDTKFVCIEEKRIGAYWLHNTDTRILSKYLTHMVLQQYVEIEEIDQVSEDLLLDDEIEECVNAVCYNLNEKDVQALESVASSYKQYGLTNCFESLKKHCNVLDEVLEKYSYSVKLVCFDNKKDAIIYKNLDRLSDEELLSAFNDKG